MRYIVVVILIFQIAFVFAIVNSRRTGDPTEGISIELSYKTAYVSATGQGIEINIDGENRLIFDNSTQPKTTLSSGEHQSKIAEIFPVNISRLIDKVGDYNHYLMLNQNLDVYHIYFESDKLITVSYVTTMGIKFSEIDLR